MVMDKPTYSSTKRYMLISAIPAWVVILIVTWAACFRESTNAIAYAQIALPIMAGLIVTLLGIHRGFGSLDFRAANLPRDQPDETGAAAPSSLPTAM